VPGGQLSLLPLHAAGTPGGASALDHVVSSYAPTVRALLHHRRRPPATERTQLAVAVPHTPGLPDLPGTAAEAAYLGTEHTGTVTLQGGQATVDAVLAALPRATWAHFGCHAGNHPVRASRSGLHLYDGVLPVPDISALRLRTAELAYLSACSTAQGSHVLTDEAIPLASAFHLAGFRHVVATLWQVDDAIAARAARRFYQLLDGSPTAEGAAVVLHQVTQELRDRHPGEPDRWAAFVHTGP
jgi:CHAT domain-containing protein